MLRLLYFIPVLYGGYFFTSKLYSLYQNWSEKTGSDVIDQINNTLQLEPHPSGARAFKQIWKGDRQVLFSKKTRHSGPRSTGTSIYILRVSPSCIKWHKHLSDQAFFWHAGGALNIHMIREDGRYTCEVLGDVTTAEKCSGHVVIPHDTWYAVELEANTGYNLCSEVYMPGFEFEDWTEGKEEEMIEKYPELTDTLCWMSLNGIAQIWDRQLNAHARSYFTVTNGLRRID